MDLKSMLLLQKQLDERIIKEHRLEDTDVMCEKILAFQVELGELANETRCFKYWSLKPSSPKQLILEEYVDGVHFLLSLGLDLNKTDLKMEDCIEGEENLTKQFSLLFQLSSQFAQSKRIAEFTELFRQYIILGNLLGFTWGEIEEAYTGKNEVNHQRQNEGY